MSEIRSAAGLLALQSLPRIGPKMALKAALGAGWPDRQADVLSDERLGAAIERARRQVADHESDGVAVLTFFDERYPDRLREIPDPPAVLFVRGDVSVLAESTLIAVVGTREPTRFGRSVTVELTQALGKAGWGVVSGLAKGIDTLAHQTALEVGTSTVAVMGGGLDRIYPAENAGLAEQIVEAGGALISEQPYGAEPRPANLVARNRLQSGLATAALVTQCGIKSGTMHTVRFATSQGRPVFCPVPPERNLASEGLWALLERPARDLCDVLPAWRNAHSLCERLGDDPLGHPIKSGEVDGFLASLDVAGRQQEIQPDQMKLATPPADHAGGNSLPS
ncbi:MAG: DNA-processing protein DprA [Solirubrobacterales bacterium]